jgi:hypothetical protein
MGSLNEFKANLEKFGTVRQSRFEVTISGIYSRDLVFRCESVNIPGIQILTKDFSLYGGQPIVKIPNGRSNEEIQMTFLAMQDMRDRYFFEEWIHKISDFETNNVAYYDDVAEPIWITIYNEKGQQSPTDAVFKPIGFNPESVNFPGKNIKLVEVYEVQLVKAIPTRIEMMQVSWADVDTLLKYSVSFSYESLKIQSYANRSGETFTHLDKVQK